MYVASGVLILCRWPFCALVEGRWADDARNM